MWGKSLVVLIMHSQVNVLHVTFAFWFVIWNLLRTFHTCKVFELFTDINLKKLCKCNLFLLYYKTIRHY